MPLKRGKDEVERIDEPSTRHMRLRRDVPLGMKVGGRGLSDRVGRHGCSRGPDGNRDYTVRLGGRLSRWIREFPLDDIPQRVKSKRIEQGGELAFNRAAIAQLQFMKTQHARCIRR